MAGWGMTGLLGALLAATTGGRVGRLPLAIVCGLAGFAYGALLDFSLMVTYGGEQSLDRFLALSARGIPFNVAHALGNFTLALVAGPALIRMLRRYRSRFEFAWRADGAGSRRRPKIAAGAACALLALATGTASLPAGQAEGAGAGSASRWLRAAQNSDGGFGAGPGEPSSPGMTGWATLGLEAAGVNPIDLRRGANTPIAYLRRTVSEITTTGDIERTILVLSAAGLDPRRFRGRDLVARLLARRGRDGSWGRQVNPTAFGVLALEAVGRPAGNRRSAAWLRGAANDDGGWGFVPGTASDADSTGAALQALAAAGGSRGAIRAGVGYLRRSQLAGGGFVLAGGPVNAQSTAWAVQGLIAAGVSPRSLRRGGRSPLDYLASVQARDGHYRYSAATDQTPVWVTGQALQAMSGDALPIETVAGRAAPSGGGGGGGRLAPAPAPAPASPAAAAKPAGGATGAARPAASGGGTSAGVAGAADEAVPGTAPQRVALAPLESGGESPDEDAGEDRSDLPIYAVAVAVLAALGGGWLLRRRRRA
jgi:energy-coupling factor transport system substrate-specific component